MRAPTRDLAALLADVQPILRDGEFGFCCIPNGMPTVSAHHHDHIFVQVSRAEDAMQLLSTLA